MSVACSRCLEGIVLNRGKSKAENMPRVQPGILGFDHAWMYYNSFLPAAMQELDSPSSGNQTGRGGGQRGLMGSKAHDRWVSFQLNFGRHGVLPTAGAMNIRLSPVMAPEHAVHQRVEQCLFFMLFSQHGAFDA